LITIWSNMALPEMFTGSCWFWVFASFVGSGNRVVAAGAKRLAAQYALETQPTTLGRSMPGYGLGSIM
jgi:hypothetical protein